MITHKLSFGEITILQEDIAEVIVNYGVEMDLELVGEFHEFLLEEMRHPFSLLINILNSYTYNFEAQQLIGSLSQINAIAVVAYDKITENVIKTVIKVPKEIPWKIMIFSERESALKWLMNEQQNLTNNYNETSSGNSNIS